jgi:hypothetical protein
MTIGPGDNYMFPRRDGILLGGSHERGESRLEPDLEIKRAFCGKTRHDLQECDRTTMTASHPGLAAILAVAVG